MNSRKGSKTFYPFKLMLSLGVLQAGAATSVAVPAWMAEYSTVAKTSVCCTRRERISWIPSLIVLNVKKMLQ